MSGWTVPVARINYSAKNFLGIPQAGADETIVGPQYANRGTENNMAVLGQGQARLCLAAPVSYTHLDVYKRQLLAWVKLSKARDFNEFRDLAGKFAISINWYYADKQGNIGYISPGRLPIRPANQDVRLPALGDGTMEWTGLNSPTANPLSYNPAQGYLANWNNQAAPGFNNDYGNWSVVDRVDQITTALASRRQFTAQQLWDLNQQFSYADLNLRYLAPTLATSVAGLPATDPARRDVELVTSWSGQTRDTDGDGFYEGPQPAIMRAWLPLLFQAVLADDLPPEVFAAYAGAGYARPVEQTSVRPAPGTKLVYNALLGARAGVPQKVDFFNGAAPASVLLSTYQQALAQLREQRGADMSGWTCLLYTSRCV